MVSHNATWELGPQTVGKHRLLSSYLKKWLLILGRWNDDLLIFDGFAGPGEYAGGEPGSPRIILDSASKFVKDGRAQRVHCVFVESDLNHYSHLKSVIDRMQVPESVRVYTRQGEFATEVEPTLDSLTEWWGDTQKSVPSFFMVDPFGIKGVPFEFFHGQLALATFGASLRRF